MASSRLTRPAVGEKVKTIWRWSASRGRSVDLAARYTMNSTSRCLPRGDRVQASAPGVETLNALGRSLAESNQGHADSGRS